MRQNRRQQKKQNQGFSLITVIVAVAFIGILGLMVLYLALNNFQMKISGQKGTDSFYTAEQALEEIRAGLQKDVGDAMSQAYIHVMENYNTSTEENNQVLDQIRQEDFRENYLVQLVAILQEKDAKDLSYETVTSAGQQYSLSHLASYLDLGVTDAAGNDTGASLFVVNPENKQAVLQAGADDGVLLKNIKVIYENPQGLASIIVTDIRLTVPEIQFPTPSTLPDLMNMIVVADGGIVCEGKTGAASVINGSIYAGTISTDTEDGLKGQPETSIWLRDNATLNITAGDKVVTESEIRLGNSADFSTAGGVNLWTGGIRLASANVSLLGKTYVADDLTVEKGSQSHVTIQGEYYGYGHPQTALADTCWNKNAYENRSQADLSSAIVINGRNTTMDLSGVQKILLAGRSYVATSGVSGSSTAANADVLTGDSISVKGSQLAYLLPSHLIRTKNGSQVTNPMSYTTYLESVLGQTTAGSTDTTKDLVDWNTGTAAWGRKSLADIGVDTDNPVQTVFYNDNSSTDGGYVYFYLNFRDEEKASAFMQLYYSGSGKSAMDSYLSFYFGGDSGVQMKNANSYLRYVTNGNVLTYDGAKKSGKLQDATDTTLSEKLQQEEINLQNSWYALNRKMITSVDLLNQSVADETTGEVHNETDSSRSVFDNMVNESAMVQFLQKQDSLKLQYTFTASDADGGLTAIMVHNGKSSTVTTAAGQTQTVDGTNATLHITQDMADKLRLVVCTGDVQIDENVEFQGIIMAKGKITLQPGAQLESSPLQAAKVFQSVVGTSQVSPKSFFWEGDKYVLGNSSNIITGDDSGRISDTFHLADYVEYENWRKE